MAADEKQKHRNIKVLLLGESSVGKTSITQRYIDNTFEDIYLSSVGVDFKFKEITKDNELIRLQIWDTAGQERFQSIARSYYRNADAAFIVFDINNESSFKKVQFWYNEISQEEAYQLVILVGNKCDLEMKVTDEVVKSSYPDSIYLKVSAKTNKNISLLFDTLINCYLKRVTQPIEILLEPETIDLITSPSLNSTKRSNCC
ncbi:hypothetical protein, conserved [Entamoeba dispar SAW760]|uniref:Uncharacterized protein n=1 Tax=Entamoeba dispar (strain ATCC PRA-260 / SAW760) TaxID=370354 RepID=B0EJF5_ENTDS|nr:uncharacterized protein EDI_133370 [Entamoeba dispar SAW760]EDR25350.1 hypothetical protein, conserved [Entamoeba dispar SAW760]|eukprot:EDR25350.1 hypothetical protein, conserved [Entamoeba dispar SAW760]